MLNKQDKKDMHKDALSKKRRKSFETADQRIEAFAQKQISTLTVDKVIKFLMDAQKIKGPFPISKNVFTATQGFKL